MIALIGNLSCDLFPGRLPRVGGGAYHGARALRELGTEAQVITRCAAAERETLLPPLVRLGTPVHWIRGTQTSTFAFEFDGEQRTMEVEEIGDAWRPDDLSLSSRVGWVHLAALFRGEFPTETIAALARRRRVSLDAQGLVRAPELGPLRLDDHFDRAQLRHISMLKASDREAAVIGDTDVPEVIVTHGARGATVNGVFIEANAIDGDPTGAGDMFGITYLVSRAQGADPVDAARRATALVSELLR